MDGDLSGVRRHHNSPHRNVSLLLEEKIYMKAMWLFVGDPVWTVYNRPGDLFDAWGEYRKFLAQTA